MIKKISIAICAALLSVSAHAMPTEEDQRVCKNWSTLAKSVMVYRQDQFPASDAMDYVRKLPEGYHELGFEIVLRAYQRVAFGALDMSKFKAIDGFAEEILVSCFVARKVHAANTKN